MNEIFEFVYRNCRVGHAGFGNGSCAAEFIVNFVAVDTVLYFRMCLHPRLFAL